MRNMWFMKQPLKNTFKFINICVSDYPISKFNIV